MLRQPDSVVRPLENGDMQTLTIPNEILIPEVCRFLDDGQSVIMKVKGSSMNPFIDGDRDSVELVHAETYQVGDVVLAWLDGDRFVLHRVFGIDGDKVTLMGDGNITGKEYCRISQLHGRAVNVVRPSGRKDSLVSPRAMRKARIWRYLLPVRRWLLAFYRRIILKLK